ncbi:hypothetical protein [Candidatus Williamhamiltonella defendens]|uniref:Uncharacterized protein n=1 Tax=Candidatus Hamiltonella defensa (Bemisia tabaci) TaxID=672795 RepID=A0A249E0K8_9ENTR|nr:hypothetical protein [Candidatus Hamiltonella defensa]ASX26687.1 hypothetical protein BA171_06565 [Candidatus Hamiltonella defensa (Bemisia tabaci)]
MKFLKRINTSSYNYTSMAQIDTNTYKSSKHDFLNFCSKNMLKVKNSLSDQIKILKKKSSINEKTDHNTEKKEDPEFFDEQKNYQ